MKNPKTDFKYFPPSMYHLVRHAIKKENRELYGIGRHGDYSKIKTEQIKNFLYEITLVKCVPAGSYAGCVTHIDFKNKKTNEKDFVYLWDGRKIISALERKLKIKESNQEFNLNELNKFYRQFNGIEIEGVAIELLNQEKNKHHNELIGIFIDYNSPNNPPEQIYQYFYK